MPYGNQTIPQNYTGTPLYPNNMVQPQQMPSQAGNSWGLNEVAGIDGMRRFPVAPGSTVTLKDSTSDLLFIKSCDMTGTMLPPRIIRTLDVTEEYEKNESPVTRREFNTLCASIEKLQQTFEELMAPAPQKEAK